MLTEFSQRTPTDVTLDYANRPSALDDTDHWTRSMTPTTELRSATPTTELRFVPQPPWRD